MRNMQKRMMQTRVSISQEMGSGKINCVSPVPKRLFVLTFGVVLLLVSVAFLSASPDTRFGRAITAAAPVSACGSLTTSSVLTADVSAPGTCFTIGAANITVDCAGHKVTFAISEPGSAFDNGNSNPGVSFDNVEIKNCLLQGGDGGSLPAIYFVSADGGRIHHNSINSLIYGVRLELSHGNGVESNMISTRSDGGVGILSEGNSNILSDNSISTRGPQATGIEIRGDPTSTYNFNSNLVTSNTILTRGMDAYGILVGSNANTVRNNVFTTRGQTAWGIALFGPSLSVDPTGNFFENNRVTTSGFQADALWMSAADNNTFTRDRLSARQGNEFNVESLYGNLAFGNRLTKVGLLKQSKITTHSLSDVAVTVETLPPATPSGKKSLGDYLDITIVTAGGSIDFSLLYSDAEVVGVTESTIRLYQYNSATAMWEVVGASSVDTAQNLVRSGTLAQTGLYASFGDLTPA